MAVRPVQSRWSKRPPSKRALPARPATSPLLCRRPGFFVRGCVRQRSSPPKRSQSPEMEPNRRSFGNRVRPPAIEPAEEKSVARNGPQSPFVRWPGGASVIERPSSASKRARGPMEMREQLDYWRASWPAPNQSPMLTTYDLRPTTYDLRPTTRDAKPRSPPPAPRARAPNRP